MKHKDIINLRNQTKSKEQLSQPKYTQPKPKSGIFRSFLFESLSPENQVKEEIEGNTQIELIKESKNVFTNSNELKNLKPNGLYAYGGPGCGKTFLMDLTYDLLKTKYKTRLHYNEFMLRVHQKSFNFSSVILIYFNFFFINFKKFKCADPLLETAIEIGKETMVIFLDEFQVTDIADAMILKRLFELCWQMGVILVTTSNRVPEDLYLNGIQRPSFLPFIPLLRENCEILSIESQIDYRKQLIEKEKEYFAKMYYGENTEEIGEAIYQTYYYINDDKDSVKFK